MVFNLYKNCIEQLPRLPTLMNWSIYDKYECYPKLHVHDDCVPLSVSLSCRPATLVYTDPEIVFPLQYITHY